MIEVSSFTPPVTRAYRYLSQLYPGQVARETAPAGYKPETGPLVIIKTGPGDTHTHQILDSLLSFEVQALTSAQAEALAFEVHRALRRWEWVEDRVYLRSAGTPVWDPEPDTRAPAYTWSMSFRFKASH